MLLFFASCVTQKRISRPFSSFLGAQQYPVRLSNLQEEGTVGTQRDCMTVGRV